MSNKECCLINDENYYTKDDKKCISINGKEYISIEDNNNKEILIPSLNENNVNLENSKYDNLLETCLYEQQDNCLNNYINDQGDKYFKEQEKWSNGIIDGTCMDGVTPNRCDLSCESPTIFPPLIYNGYAFNNDKIEIMLDYLLQFSSIINEKGKDEILCSLATPRPGGAPFPLEYMIIQMVKAQKKSIKDVIIEAEKRKIEVLRENEEENRLKIKKWWDNVIQLYEIIKSDLESNIPEYHIYYNKKGDKYYLVFQLTNKKFRLYYIKGNDIEYIEKKKINESPQDGKTKKNLLVSIKGNDIEYTEKKKINESPQEGKTKKNLLVQVCSFPQKETETLEFEVKIDKDQQLVNTEPPSCFESDDEIIEIKKIFNLFWKLLRKEDTDILNPNSYYSNPDKEMYIKNLKWFLKGHLYKIPDLSGFRLEETGYENKLKDLLKDNLYKILTKEPPENGGRKIPFSSISGNNFSYNQKKKKFKSKKLKKTLKNKY